MAVISQLPKTPVADDPGKNHVRWHPHGAPRQRRCTPKASVIVPTHARQQSDEEIMPLRAATTRGMPQFTRLITYSYELALRVDHNTVDERCR